MARETLEKMQPVAGDTRDRALPKGYVMIVENVGGTGGVELELCHGAHADLAKAVGEEENVGDVCSIHRCIRRAGVRWWNMVD